MERATGSTTEDTEDTELTENGKGKPLTAKANR
jgi:hypothetical protein